MTDTAEGRAVRADRRRPPFDPDVDLALRSRDDIVTTLSPEGIQPLRETAVRPDEDAITLGGAFELTRHFIQGPEGDPLTIVLLRPRSQSGAVPVIYHVHGGGMVVGTAYDVLPSMAALAQRVGAAVASVEYRLAPEHRYPAAVDDVYAGLTWLAGAGAGLGLDTGRILIEGVSAGGGLAAAAALLARDSGGPALLGQMLICPMLDHRNDSDSGWQMLGAGAWDRTANATGWAAYLGDLPRDEVPAYASPAVAADLSGLPPTFLEVGSAETFRDEDIDYARRIWAAGGDAELHVWPGGAHGFEALVPEASLTLHARNARADWIMRLLSRSAGDAV